MHARTSDRLWTVARTLFGTLCLLMAYASFRYLYARSGGAPGSLTTKFAGSGLDVPAHFFASGLALALVPLQLSPAIRRSWPQLHRLGGWLSVAVIILGGLSGLSLAREAHGGAVTATSFAIIALGWLYTMWRGMQAVLARDLAGHRRWMARCIAISSAAISLRLFQAFGMGMLGLPFEVAYPFSAWLCWPFNLLACEWLLHRAGRQR